MIRKILFIIILSFIIAIPAMASIKSCTGIGSCTMNQTPNMTPGPENLTASSHNFLQNLTTSDDHSQYAYLPGRDGGQTLTGGTTSGNLTLNGSMNNGFLILQPTNGYVGIGGTPATAFHIIGKSNVDSRILMQSSTADHTTKAGRLSIANYHNDQSPFTVFLSQSHSVGKNFVEIGGGSSSENSATEIQIYTGLTQTTPSGTLQAVFNNIGYFGLGANPPTAQLDTTGSVRIRNCSGTPVFDAFGNLTCASDDKLKKDKHNYSNEAPLPKPIQYKFNDISGYDTNREWTGFSANDVEQNYPECVISRPEYRYEQQCIGEGNEKICGPVGIPTGTYTKSLDTTCLLAAAFNTINRQQAVIDRICSKGNPSLCEV